MRHRKSAWRCRCPQRSVRACSYPPILANAMFSPATVRAPEERSRRRAICSHAGFEAQRAYRLRRRARNDSRCGFVDDGLSATGPLAVEKSDDFPTARPFVHKLHSAPIICIEIILEDTRWHDQGGFGPLAVSSRFTAPGPLVANPLVEGNRARQAGQGRRTAQKNIKNKTINMLRLHPYCAAAIFKCCSLFVGVSDFSIVFTQVIPRCLDTRPIQGAFPIFRRFKTWQQVL